MAAGVGKTYRMLQEGRQAQVEGRDVVIGYLEPHDRPETAEQAEGIEVVPRRSVSVGTLEVEEMDLDAALRRAPELAQGAEVVLLEEVDERDLGAVLRVDLAGLEPLLERFGSEVDQHDLVCLVQHAVGERLANAHAGELEDGVVEALEMLHVDRRDHVDPGCGHVVDVLVALLVAHARRVRVRELVDERERRPAGDHGVHVHLLELERAVCTPQPRHDLEAFGERRGLRPVVRLEIPDHDIASLRVRVPPFLEHSIRLADPGGHPEQDPVLTLHALMLRRRCARRGRSA